jgi:chromosome segregation ATPase
VLQKRIKDLSQAYADLNDDAARLENEKIMVQEEKARLTRDKQSVEDQITQRDRRINELSLKMTIMKIAGMIGALLFFVALAVEYRILKKRYLFFT